MTNIWRAVRTRPLRLADFSSYTLAFLVSKCRAFSTGLRLPDVPNLVLLPSAIFHLHHHRDDSSLALTSTITLAKSMRFR